MMQSSIATAATSSTTQQTVHQILDLLIVGGGLSGVFVAHEYHFRSTGGRKISTEQQADASWKLLEARSVLGGRLVNDGSDHRIDLGGAWIWPQHQPNLRHLIPQLGLSTFPQPDDDGNDLSQLRIDGGAVTLIEALSRNLPKDNVVLNAPVTKCTLVVTTSSDNTDDYVAGNDKPNYIQVETKATNASPSICLRAKQVVIAVPPKLIWKHIQFDPPLSLSKQHAMETSYTWMAGVTKIAVVYPTQFWNEKTSIRPSVRMNMGLPTHLGPAFQVYDASTRDGTVPAITFFALVEPNSPAQNNDQVLAKQVTHQLARVWDYLGVDEDVIQQLLHSYSDIHVQRWPLEEYISEDSAPQQIHPHPHPVRALSQSEWQGSLLFAGSESDLVSPGVMEGAIGAALRVLRYIP